MAQDYLTDAFIRLRQKLKGISGRMLPDAAGGLQLARQEIYGLTGVTIYRKRGNGDG